LKREDDEQQKAVDSLRASLVEMKSLVDRHQCLIEQFDIENSNLKSQLAEHESQSDQRVLQLEEEIEVLKSEKEKLTEKVTEDLKNLENRECEQEKTVSDSQAEIEFLRDELAKNHQRIEDANEALKQALEDSSVQVSSLEAEIKVLKSEKKKLTETVENHHRKHEAEVRVLQAAIQSTREQIQEQNAAFRASSCSSVDDERCKRVYEQQLADLTAEPGAASQLNAALAAELVSVQSQFKEFKAQSRASHS
jgi:chromosome segregation ATPase